MPGFEAIAAGYVAVILGFSAVLDALYREIDPEVWYVSLPLATALGVGSLLESGFRGPLWVPYLLGGLVLASLAILYYVGLMGGADVGAAALLWLGLPVYGQALPTIYTALLYSAPIVALYYLYKMAGACRLRCIAGGPRVKGSQLLAMRWWAPRGYRIEGDVHELLAEQNLYDESLRATPLMPWVTILFAGFLLTLVFGDGPIIELLRGILS